MRGPFDIVDLHSAGSALGVHTAEPDVMLTGTVDLTLKTRHQVFRFSAHELSVSIRCIERRIWVETAPVSIRYAESDVFRRLTWKFECAPRDSNPKPAD
jgi:hypothetical protein